MELRQFGSTGIKVSELCLGAMTFGRETPEPESVALLDRFLDAGGNFVDTADTYGGGASEEILGRALGRRRDQIVLATKFRMTAGPGPNDAGASRRNIRREIEASLRRLQTDWIDLYQIHCWDARTPLTETLSTLDDLVREGKVRYLGASNFTGWQLATALGQAQARGWEPFISLQPQYSLITRDIERELLPLADYAGLAIMPWSPLGGGLLTGKYRAGEEAPADTRGGDATPSAGLMRLRLQRERNFRVAEVVTNVASEIGKTPAQVALNWVRHRPGVTSPIIGVRTMAQLDDNLGAIGWQLDDEHLGVLDDASAIDLGYPHDFIGMINSLG
ncbi:MAG TPA: aldo/keto reductase [Acidimicrobiia bacterium]|nr:aldo/keto reductase [Acidimicrobiia bacterium]